MTCSRCRNRFDAVDGAPCPYCGARILPSTGALKTSLILISARGTDAVYNSMDEVPAPLRQKLLKSTSGLNSRTILIADERGRDEIARAVAGLPAGMQRRLLKSSDDEPQCALTWLDRPGVKMAIAWLLGAGSVLLIWFAFTHKRI